MNARRSVGTILIGLAPLLALGIAGGARAQAVYRCADNSYGQQPCEGGRTVPADDPRTPQQQLESQSAARREAVRADAMEQSRLQREAQAERAQAVALRQAAAPAPMPAADPLPPHAVPAAHRPEVFVARVPGPRKLTRERRKKRMD